MSEFADVEERLARYQPAAPSDAARRRTAELLGSGTGAGARRWRLVAAGLALALLAPAAWWARQLWVVQDASAGIPAEFVQKWAANSPEIVPDARSYARVVVVLFTDWQCSPCVDLYPALTSLVESYNRAHKGQVDLIVRDWPLSSTCNPHVPVDTHQVACDLASAVRVSRKHGREAAMIDWIRSNRDRFGDPGAAEAIHGELRRLLGGIDVATESAEALAAVRQEVSGNSGLRISATPTVFVNGRRLMNPTASLVDWGIRLELAGSHK